MILFNWFSRIKSFNSSNNVKEFIIQRIYLYSSYSGASEPRNMAYMVRLGLWGEGTPFRNFSEFLGAVEKR